MDKSTEIDPTLPEVVQDFLRSGAHLEEIRLDRRGRWTHEGLSFENQRVIDLFSRSVGRTEGGTWVLEVGQFTYPIVVEDTGFFVERAFWRRQPPIIVLSDGTQEELALETLQYQPPGRLYCDIKEGDYRARFKRVPYHAIMDHLVEANGEIYLELHDQRYHLGTMSSEAGDRK